MADDTKKEVGWQKLEQSWKRLKVICDELKPLGEGAKAVKEISLVVGGLGTGLMFLAYFAYSFLLPYLPSFQSSSRQGGAELFVIAGLANCIANILPDAARRYAVHHRTASALYIYRIVNGCFVLAIPVVLTLGTYSNDVMTYFGQSAPNWLFSATMYLIAVTLIYDLGVFLVDNQTINLGRELAEVHAGIKSELETLKANSEDSASAY